MRSTLVPPSPRQQGGLNQAAVFWVSVCPLWERSLVPHSWYTTWCRVVRVIGTGFPQGAGSVCQHGRIEDWRWGCGVGGIGVSSLGFSRCLFHEAFVYCMHRDQDLQPVSLLKHIPLSSKFLTSSPWNCIPKVLPSNSIMKDCGFSTRFGADTMSSP